MKWKQFLTPVQGMDARQAKDYLDSRPLDSVTILDVRQPGEYEAGHIPGAKLIPLPELKDRSREIAPDKPVVVYCAIGGRSRIAAQMLSGESFPEVYNLSGGFKAWQENRAVGPEDSGLQLFNGSESAEEVLVTAYSLEEGLREFYLSMIPRVETDAARNLFTKLADIEIHHQDRIIKEYERITGTHLSRSEFAEKITGTAMEGGLTGEEYAGLYRADLNAPFDIISLAMAIEAQALDMYSRASRNLNDPVSRKLLSQIAHEEQTHLQLLGELIDLSKI